MPGHISKRTPIHAPPKPATPQFYYPPRQPSGLKSRTSGATMAAIRATLAAMTEEDRTFPAVQALAAQHRTNGQVVWRMAQALGCPPRNGFRAAKVLTPERVLEAEARFNAGEEIGPIAEAFGCSPSALRNRLERLDDEREDAAEAIAKAREAARKASPRVYQSAFIRPLALAALTTGRARPATFTRNCAPGG